MAVFQQLPAPGWSHPVSHLLHIVFAARCLSSQCLLNPFWVPKRACPDYMPVPCEMTGCYLASLHVQIKGGLRKGMIFCHGQR